MWQGRDCIAFLDIFPLSSGHVLLVPRRHVQKTGEMNREEAREMGEALVLLSRAIDRYRDLCHLFRFSDDAVAH